MSNVYMTTVKAEAWRPDTLYFPKTKKPKPFTVIRSPDGSSGILQVRVPHPETPEVYRLDHFKLSTINADPSQDDKEIVAAYKSHFSQ